MLHRRVSACSTMIISSGLLPDFAQSPGRRTAAPTPLPSKPASTCCRPGQGIFPSSFCIMNYLPPVSIIEDKMPGLDHDPDTHDSDGLLKDSESVYSWTFSDREDHRHRGFWWIVGMIIAISALSCLTGLFIGYQHHHSDEACSRRTSHYCMPLS
jgi:hypothetical protein